MYEAKVLGIPDAHDLDRLARGVTIDGRRTAVADVKWVGEGAKARLIITVREGRNRQVRKMCDAIGHPVAQLKRVAIGPIRDATLKLGHWREMMPAEVERLKRSAVTTHTVVKAESAAHRKRRSGARRRSASA